MKKHLYSKLKVLVLNGFTIKSGLLVLAVLFCVSNDLSAGIKPSRGFRINHVGRSVTIASPTLGTGTVTGFISACAGMASVSPHIQQFEAFGNGLTANITVTAPTGFQVSLARGSGYGNNITISQSGGVADAIVYVRSATSAPVGNIAGNVTISTAGAASQNVGVTGVVNALPAVSPVINQTVNNGAATTAINFTGSGGFNWVNNTPGIGLTTSGSGNIPSFTAINTGTSPITATITATPVSPGFAYIANSTSNTVSVINTATNTVVATIPAGLGPQAVAVSPDGRKVYVTNNSPNHFFVIPGSVWVINTATNTVIDSLIAPNASGVAIGPDGTVYVTTEHSNMGFLLSSSAPEIQVGSFPSGVAVSPDGTMVYVANPVDNTVSVINTTPLFQDVVATINLGFSPVGASVSPDGSRVYVTNGGSVAVINTTSNTVIATIPTGGGFADGIAVTPDGGRLYVAGGNANTVSVINTATNAIVATIPVSGGPSGISVTPDGSRVYVTDSQANNVSVINTATNTIVATIPVGHSPNSVGNFITGAGCTGTPVTFTITVNPANSANANLTSLKLSKGTLSPNFASDTTNYKAIVPNAVTSITVTPTAADSSATITVNGTTVASGSPSASISLSVGPNIITTVVTAGSTSKTYTVIVTRRASDYAFLANLEISKGNLKPDFAWGTFAYTARVSRTTFEITVTPIAGNAFASIKVNGITVASGTASPPIALSNGINDITIVVTAQNGINTKTYTLAVTKEPAPQNSLDKQLAVDGINVHLGISPNGDGINDILVIDGITAYPENKLLIMNSNGSLVFEAEGYDNSTRVFDGHSNKNGSLQLPGTYFYSLDYMVGKEKKHNSGFFILKY